jgi:hypothetical protein
MPISSGFSFYQANYPSPKRIIRPQIVSRAPKVTFLFSFFNSIPFVNMHIILKKKERMRTRKKMQMHFFRQNCV